MAVDEAVERAQQARAMKNFLRVHMGVGLKKGEKRTKRVRSQAKLSPAVQVEPPTPEGTPVKEPEEMGFSEACADAAESVVTAVDAAAGAREGCASPALPTRMPRPLSADVLSPANSAVTPTLCPRQQQRAATPTARTKFFGDSPVVRRKGVLPLPSAGLCARLHSPQKRGVASLSSTPKKADPQSPSGAGGSSHPGSPTGNTEGCGALEGGPHRGVGYGYPEGYHHHHHHHHHGHYDPGQPDAYYHGVYSGHHQQHHGGFYPPYYAHHHHHHHHAAYPYGSDGSAAISSCWGAERSDSHAAAPAGGGCPPGGKGSAGAAMVGYGGGYAHHHHPCDARHGAAGYDDCLRGHPAGGYLPHGGDGVGGGGGGGSDPVRPVSVNAPIPGLPSSSYSIPQHLQHLVGAGGAVAKAEGGSPLGDSGWSGEGPMGAGMRGRRDSGSHASTQGMTPSQGSDTEVQPGRGALKGIYGLGDLKNRAVELSKDQEGSRFVQKRLVAAPAEEKALLFDEVVPRTMELVADMFGNYVIQKLLELGTREQVDRISECFRGRILELSLQTYGCRVVQKALEVMSEEYREMTADELKHLVPKCVQDQNGNHVIQKCIETMPEKVGFIVRAFTGNVHHLATHAYGCRVIQRLLEHCKGSPIIHPVCDEIVKHSSVLVADQYGNYVVQDLLIHGNASYRNGIVDQLKGLLMELSKHKFASNVVEKLFQYGTSAERFEFLGELTRGGAEGQSSLLCMVRDQFANYVVQKLLDLADADQQQLIINHIKPHSAMLRRFNYGKHIVARVERLLGQGSEPSSPSSPLAPHTGPQYDYTYPPEPHYPGYPPQHVRYGEYPAPPTPPYGMPGYHPAHYGYAPMYPMYGK